MEPVKFYRIVEVASEPVPFQAFTRSTCHHEQIYVQAHSRNAYSSFLSERPDLFFWARTHSGKGGKTYIACLVSRSPLDVHYPLNYPGHLGRGGSGLTV